ncbi:assimilatory sulfite reductase (NADPH) flavoprotein subunit [Dokdonella soli]|uniref:assimilatory sulfite reductase (NADPH) flavoprotein subunit n=1 Tax=Dokdonella soli TaxID=529810 RepID=UPI003611E635
MSAEPIRLPFSTLPEDKAALLARLVEGLEPAALYWLSGYTAALAAPSGSALRPVAIPAAPLATAISRLSIIYGSQTGNARRIAERLAAEAEAGGLAVRLVRAGAYPLRELAHERLLLVVISTQGDGDPPDDARGFIEFIAGKRAPRLSELRYGVLALGDSSYPRYCAVGRALDARLEELGAQRVLAHTDADVDIDSVAGPWHARALAAAREALKAPHASATVTPLRPHASVAAHSRERPFAAAVLANQRIVARASERDVRHVELSLEGSGLAYEPGDSLGVWPENPPALVDALLGALSLDGEAAVHHDGRALPLRQWLTREREITRLARPFVAAHAAHAGDVELNRLLAPDRAAALGELLRNRQPIDLLREYPAVWTATELVAALRPLTPRLYSIASSRKVVGDEVHLTVGVVDYEAFGTRHHGAASQFLAAAGDDVRIPVFIEANERFRLPTDATRDVIMIGPGTGVAPFRGFVQERREIGAAGRNWLIFGNRNFHNDFLYQTEWQDALRDGSLHRLDLAFSRDDVMRIPRKSPHIPVRTSQQKIYVQDRLHEHARELYAWLDNGAHLYVCGDATRMAKDVHAALVDIVATHDGRDRDAAESYLSDLIQQGRYARDVY